MTTVLNTLAQVTTVLSTLLQVTTVLNTLTQVTTVLNTLTQVTTVLNTLTQVTTVPNVLHQVTVTASQSLATGCSPIPLRQSVAYNHLPRAYSNLKAFKKVGIMLTSIACKMLHVDNYNYKTPIQLTPTHTSHTTVPLTVRSSGGSSFPASMSLFIEMNCSTEVWAEENGVQAVPIAPSPPPLSSLHLLLSTPSTLPLYLHLLELLCPPNLFPPSSPPPPPPQDNAYLAFNICIVKGGIQHDNGK